MRSLILTVFLLFIAEGFCFAQNKSQTLQQAYQLARSTKGPDSAKYQRQFFNAFPSNFKSLNELYGWDKSADKPAPLYKVSLEHINYFFNLRTVNQDSLTKKIIKISINGEDDADAVSYFQSNLITRVITQKAAFIKVLKGFTKKDIVSVWCFYFDYEDATAREGSYRKLLQMISKDKELASLVTNSYQDAVTKNAHSH